jgi:hypothetical protein
VFGVAETYSSSSSSFPVVVGGGVAGEYLKLFDIDL